ncbi:MAG: TolC family outer membrane protein [Methyloprofundus sp.]|nr:TolC family outer membrane protein [Methyloprofundus sp.]
MKVLVFCLWGISASVLADDLMSVYQQAVYADPNLKAAGFQFEVSAAQQAQAGGALLPQISANVNISYNNRKSVNDLQLGDDEYKGERYSVGLTQSLIDVAKIYNWKRYQSLTDKSLIDLYQAQQVLMYDVVERYFTVLAEQDNWLLISQETETTARQLEQIKRQFEKHLVKITDVYELEAKLDSLIADAIEAEALIDIAKQGLIELTGMPFKQLSTLRSDIEFAKLQGDLQLLTEQAQLNSPLIRAQEMEIEAADYDLTSQQARHLPVVDLELQYYNTDTGYQNTQTPTIDTKVAAININIPIFSGGATQQRAHEAAMQLELGKQQKIALLRSVEKETRDAFLTANASVRRIKAANRALHSSVKAREAMEKGFSYGMQSIGDVLISQAREYMAKRDLLTSKYIYIKNRIRFERASGILSPASLEEINQWLEIRPAAG